MHSSALSGSLPNKRWRVGLVGDTVDDRGLAATEHVREKSDRLLRVTYKSSTHVVSIGDRAVAADDLSEVLNGDSSDVVLETTTLGFVETFLLLRALFANRASHIDIVYAEPGDYTRPTRGFALQRRDFELSQEVELFSGLPGAALHLSPGRSVRAVFLLGYEGQRLAQALEQTELRPSSCVVVFGVPAFEPGWEMNSFANNVGIIVERHLRGGVLFAAADNPLSAYEAIARVQDACAEEEALMVSPIGTKPHGIGAALFAATHEGVGLLYDHPTRKPGRSSDVGTWHLFEVSL
jgi:hypothetical protein